LNDNNKSRSMVRLEGNGDEEVGWMVQVQSRGDPFYVEEETPKRVYHI
jgi:hypothetical protein